MKKHVLYMIVFFCLAFFGRTSDAYNISDGSDGPFLPAVSITLTPDTDGRFDYTEIQIGSNIHVDFDLSLYEGSIVEFLGTGDIVINGILDASGTDLFISSPSRIFIGGELWGDSITMAANEIIVDGTIYVPESLTLVAGGHDLQDSLVLDGNASLSIDGDGSITIDSGGEITIVDTGAIVIGGEGSITIGEGGIHPPVNTPIPTTVILLGSGLIGLAGFKRKFKQ